MTEKRIRSERVREICGGISKMTEWRWANDPSLNFPKPIKIGRIRYWKESEILAWLDAQERKSIATDTAA